MRMKANIFRFTLLYIFERPKTYSYIPKQNIVVEIEKYLFSCLYNHLWRYIYLCATRQLASSTVTVSTITNKTINGNIIFRTSFYHITVFLVINYHYVFVLFKEKTMLIMRQLFKIVCIMNYCYKYSLNYTIILKICR